MPGQDIGYDLDHGKSIMYSTYVTDFCGMISRCFVLSVVVDQ
jgi:hypothetical protein